MNAKNFHKNPDLEFLNHLKKIKADLPIEYTGHHKRLSDYQNGYDEVMNFFDKCKRVAFIGDVGKGKTSAICKAFGLYNAENPNELLLSHSSGRTTICEVEIIPNSSDVKIEVVPYEDGEVLSFLKDYSTNLFNKIGSKSTQDQDVVNDNAINEGFALSIEIERALKNMLSIQGVNQVKEDGKVKTRSVPNDVIYARQFSNEKDLFDSLKDKLKIETRRVLVLERPDGYGDSFNWVKDTFKNLNLGKNDNVSLPKKIYIYWDGEIEDYNLVDTKGLDGTTNRRDINQCLEDDATINVICSSFNDAPDTSVRKIIEQMISVGLKESLYTRTILLIIDRDGLSSKVNDDDGEYVDNKYLGREIRISHVISDLEHKYGLDGDRIDMICFDAFQDENFDLLKLISTKFDKLNNSYKDALSNIQAGVKELADEYNSQSFDAAKASLSNVLGKWFDDAKKFNVSIDCLHQALNKEINMTRAASTVRASVARRGYWYNLEMYEILAQQSKSEVNKNKKKLIDDFYCLIDSCIKNPELIKAYSISIQLKECVKRFHQSELNELYVYSDAFYKQDLYNDTNMWNNAQSEWGQGSGYKDRVKSHIDIHFRKEPKKLERILEKKSNKKWQKLLSDMQSML